MVLIFIIPGYAVICQFSNFLKQLTLFESIGSVAINII